MIKRATNRKPSLEIPSRTVSPTISLPYGRKMGHLKLGPNQPTGKDRRIHTTCDCGRSQWIPTATLVNMAASTAHCGHPECTVATIIDKIWNAEDGLRMQLAMILLRMPDQVMSQWGGTFDDYFQPTFDEAYADLLSYVTRNRMYGVWLNRIDEDLPFMDGNVTMGDKPDKALHRFNKCIVYVAGVRMSVPELRELSGLTTTQLLLKVYEYGNDEDLIVKLMEENDE